MNPDPHGLEAFSSQRVLGVQLPEGFSYRTWIASRTFFLVNMINPFLEKLATEQLAHLRVSTEDAEIYYLELPAWRSS